ncbi:hypothetical protein OpiT1DRAFT_05101 [Opitutaceae bacterium TAV1]|nr:hypothetical protein OpiT1DRAFT_05101 [Opitutaceae bacterium TAV1]
MQPMRPPDPSPAASLPERERRRLSRSVRLNVALCAAVLILGAMLVREHRAADTLATGSFKASLRSGPDAPRLPSTPVRLSASDAARAGLTRTDSVLLNAINHGDASSLLDALRKTGMAEEDIRQIVRGTARLHLEKEHRREAQERFADDRPWWQNARPNDDPEYLQFQKEYAQKYKDLNAELNTLLGPDPRRIENLRKQNPWLSDKKIAQLLEVQNDYGELRNDTWEQSRGFRTATDKGGFDMLRAEEQRDIAALLSPDEYIRYYVAQNRNLRQDATLYNLTESETLQLAALQKAFDDQFPPGSRPANDAERELRRQARAPLDALRNSLLTDDRLDTSLVARNTGDYSLLRNATERFNLPPETPAQVYALRDEVAHKSRRIATDPTLDEKGKRAALAALAGDTRNHIRQKLGDEIATAYFDNRGMEWLKDVEKGKTVEFDKKTGQPKAKPLPSPPKKKKTGNS